MFFATINQMFYGFSQVVTTGDPKSRNDRTVELQNGGIMEQRKITPNPKRRNRGITERQKILANPKRPNDGKSPKILKDGIM